MSFIALVDCNSFFCSCERVFQPRLRNQPVIVLSNNDGCVVSRTDEAKKLGIAMGEPFFKIKKFCSENNVAVFSSNFALYGDMSRRVMRVLSEHSPQMEVYSVDEAFLSMEGVATKNIDEIALAIKQQVYQFTGIPVSVGIGPTKVLAKAANNFAKKNKQSTAGVVSFLQEEKYDECLKKIPVGDLWGVGRQSVEKLQALRIYTAWELKKSNEKLIQRNLSITGKRIVEELRGNSCISLNMIENDKKSILSSRSFGRPVKELSELKESIANHVTTVCEKLRKQDGVASEVMVFIRTNRFKNTKQYYGSNTAHLSAASSTTNKIIHVAFQILDQIYKKDFEYNKAGVLLMGLRKKSELQLDLFNSFDSPKDEELMKVLDLINKTQGKGSLKFAACGVDQFWKMLSQMKSRHYSTRWQDLLSVG